jgi:hypothetical protein
MARERSRSGGSEPAAAPRRSPFIKGDEGRTRIKHEEEKAKQRKEQAQKNRDMPFRFFMKPDTTTEFIILDDKPEFFLYEHSYKDARGKWGGRAICIDEWDNCPMCETVGEPAYTLMLSVIDLTEYVNRDKETVTWSRKLLPVKTAQQKKFMRIYEREGSLRGAVIEASRDGDKSASIGNDLELIEFAPEEELAGYVRKWTDREKKKHTEDCSVAINYEEIFEMPTQEDLEALLGGGSSRTATPGSRREAERSLDDGKDGWDDEEDKDGEWGKKKPARQGRGRQEEEKEEAPRARKGRRTEPDEEEEEEAPRSRRGRQAPVEEAPRARRGRGREEEEEEEEEEAPRSRRGRAAKVEEEAPPARRGRASKRDDPPFDPDEEEEEAPSRRRRGR